MKTLSLPLFSTSEFPVKSVSQPLNETPTQLSYSANTQATLESTLSAIIPNQTEENKVGRMRKHLGDTAKSLSDMQVETIMTEFQFLIDTWLDEYEKEVFNGITLKEIMNER